MVIYFEDGEMKPNFNLPFKPDYRIDATLGFSNNLATLEKILSTDPEAKVYTNSLVALSTKYGWCSKTNRPQIYIRYQVYGSFTRIDYLTHKEIKRDYNILYHYVNGGFREND